MRWFAIALLAASGPALLPLCCAAFAAEPEVINGIAAVVNGDVITYSQVRELSAPREKLLRSQYTGEELEKALKEAREAALKDLIDRRLIIQAFQKEKYQIPDHFVEEQLRGIIKESFGGDRNTFIKTLEAQSYSMGEFKQKEIERMIVQAMRAKNVKRNPISSPTKVEELLQATPRGIHRQGTGQTAHDHDPRPRRYGAVCHTESAGRRGSRPTGRRRRVRAHRADLF